MLPDFRFVIGAAMATSLRAVTMNPGPMALWGLIVAAALVIGASAEAASAAPVEGEGLAGAAGADEGTGAALSA